MPTEIIIIGMLRALVEVAGLMLLLRGAMWLFGPKAREGNFVFDMLSVGVTPFLRLSRKITPRAVPDAYMPAVAFLLLLSLWIVLGIAQHALCAAHTVDCTPRATRNAS